MIKGFTLIEMMVSIAIFGIITAVVIYNYGSFNSNILVTNLAYEMALAIRQAQSYGLSVKSIGSGSADYAYGVHFSSSDYRKFYLYADLDKDGKATIGTCGLAGDECLEELVLRGDSSITGLCARISETAPCDGGSAEYLDIQFIRPNPEAVIVLDKDYQSYIYNATIYTDRPSPKLQYQLAEIYIEGSRGNKKKKIVIQRTGQISVQDN